MSRFLLLLPLCAAMALAAGCGSDDVAETTTPQQPIARAALDRALPSTVAITSSLGGASKTGTGTLLADGAIVTDAGLVEVPSGSASPIIDVRVSDGRELSATVAGIDEVSGLAVVTAQGLSGVPKARAGRAPRLGDDVAVVGWLSGRRAGVDSGTVAVDGRASRSPGASEVGLFEVSASIGSQALGGPVVDRAGRVQGIMTGAISSMVPSGSVAIPVERAVPIAEALRDDGRVPRAYLGLQTVELTPTRAAELGIDSSRGLLVKRASPGSPAAFSALEMPTGSKRIGGRSIPTGGDVVLRAGGRPVSQPEDLDAVLARSLAGERLPLLVLRNGRTITVRVTLVER